ncbi:MAG: 1-deoxy-D-xylulose-5-phosphate reductoisomerase [bacterium]|jgi:1-deoxy-D-xylulose-5-phosphate reductoisomerase|nr:1-deoxy-D-xylulose-5-phosphate reductoisomerase [Planctomycetota bacterium]HIL51111.1 1-deoxy-D-xylulose-5-phosphate reductoisomerase [Planctomycetota bacterium]
MTRLLLLGSTGSIGTQTLDLVRSPGSGLEVVGLAAGSSWEALAAQAREFRPAFVALADLEAAERLAPELPRGTTLFSGPDAACQLAREADYRVCMHGMVGARGVLPSVAVLERGKSLALANKESLVVAGELLMQLAAEHGAEIIPVDSEHSAIFQCLRGEDLGRVRRVLLTASGGPFRGRSASELAGVTPAMALEHPNWDMGPRITVGSATLMNKALEVIEVHHLFGLERERIEVVVHPQSLVHSMLEFIDGSVLCQMGPPDMRGPIHYALHHPDRAPLAMTGFDLTLFSELTFEAPDPGCFPALDLGFRCVDEGADSGSVLNAADEVAVEAFLGERIDFQDIPRINAAVLDRRPGLSASIEELLEADSHARALAQGEVAALAP